MPIGFEDDSHCPNTTREIVTTSTILQLKTVRRICRFGRVVWDILQQGYIVRILLKRSFVHSELSCVARQLTQFVSPKHLSWQHFLC